MDQQQFSKHVDILFKREDHMYNLTHTALGIAGESGELVDTIKKHVIYGKPLDRGNIKEELGDLLFYMDALVHEIGTDWEEIRAENYNKLRVRYPDGYSDTAAIERRDK